MSKNSYIQLNNRHVIAISGNDKYDFLQGIITNDINKVNSKQSIYALMLTPQGKFLYDFFISLKDDELLIDCASKQKEAILKKFKMYKLRRDVDVKDYSDKYEVVGLLGDKINEKVKNNQLGSTLQFCKGVAFKDPRKDVDMGRCIIEKENKYNSLIVHDFVESDFDNYEYERIQNFIPSGDFDMVTGESFPLDFAMDYYNAIDYKKGCYIGQEVTARVHYKGKRRKKIFQIKAKAECELPSIGGNIFDDNEKKAGVMCSHFNNIGLALMNFQEVDSKNFKNYIFVSSL